MRSIIYLLSILFLVSSVKTTRAELFTGTKEEMSSDFDNDKDDKDDKDEEKGKTKSYNDLLKGFTSQEGLFNLHTKGRKLYFEIPDSLLGREFLLASRVSATSNNKDLVAGQMSRQPLLVKFSKDDEKIYMHIVNTDNVCDENSDTYKSMQRNYLNPIMASFKIKAFSPDSTATVFDVSKFFATDIKSLNPFRKKTAVDILFHTNPLSGTFDATSSCILRSKAFPKNVNVRSRLAYKISDAPFVAEMTRSIILLSEEPMKPRISDPRLGFFVEKKRVFDENKDRVEIVKYINRWRIEPKEEDLDKYKRGELVEPKKPIVYYVDTAIPEKFRNYIMQGIEDWQPVFEAIGFKNAIIAKEYPKNDPNFDPDDIRYSCYRYVSTSVANSKGPSWVDPRSGEIVTGDVLYYSNVTKILHDWRFIQTANLDPNVRGETFPTEVMGESLRYVAAHEIGHTLGLLHNMGASHSYPVDSLRSASFTQKYGTASSVMDYARYNYVAQPGDKGVRLTPLNIGVYDYYAMSWAYKPIFDAKTPEAEYETLNQWIMEKSDDPMYHYGPQQFFMNQIDPASLSEDLGDNSVKAAEYGVKNLKFTMKHLKEWTSTPNRDYTRMKGLYGQIFRQFKRYIGHANTYLGGYYLNDIVAGENKKASVLVSKEQQRYALDFIFDNIRDLPNWLLDNDVVDCFVPEDMKLGKYSNSVIKGLLSSRITVHLSWDEKKNPNNEYSVLEYMDDVYDRIFALTKKGENLNFFERSMQYTYIKTLFSNGGYFSSSARGKRSYTLEEEHLIYQLDKMDIDLESLVLSGKEADVKTNMNPIYLYELEKAKKLIKKHMKKGDLNTQIHYKNLYNQISSFLQK